jgi:DNA-binding PadR family transcriptional regulator
MPTDKLGEFELLVLLSILRQGDQPYANRVRDDLEAHSGRTVTRGALYRTLDRLADKAFVAWSLEGDEVPERGGHPRRRLAVTDTGLAAIRRSRDILRTFLDGVDPILDASR